MKMNSFVTLRRIVVVLLAAVLMATIIMVVMATLPKIQYLIAKSLAVDCPLYGSVENDLAFIERVHAKETWGPLFISLTYVQLGLVFFLTVIVVRFLYPTDKQPKTKSVSDTSDWEDTVRAAVHIEVVNGVEEALAGLKQEGGDA